MIHPRNTGLRVRRPGHLAASVLCAAVAAAVLALVGRAAPATLAAPVNRPPSQFTSSTATPRLVVWTPTPDRQATERATSAAATAAATLGAAPTVGTAPPGESAVPGGPGSGGGAGGTPGPGAGTGLGTPGSGAGGVGVAPGAEATPGGDGASGGTGAAGGGDGPASGAGPPGAGGVQAPGNAGGSPIGESGPVSAAGFAYRRAASWLPPVADGVIAELWARYGSPMEGASWASRLTGEALGARRPGVFGRIWFYVAVVALLAGSATWLLIEVRRLASEQANGVETIEPTSEP